MKLVIELNELVEVTKSLESGLDTPGAERIRQLITRSPSLHDVAGIDFEQEYEPVEVYADPEPEEEPEVEPEAVPLREQVLALLSERPMTRRQIEETTRTTSAVSDALKRLEASGLVAAVAQVKVAAGHPVKLWAAIGTPASVPEAIEAATEVLRREAAERNSQIRRPGRKPKYSSQSIVDTIARRGPLSVSQLMEALDGASQRTVRTYLMQLEKAKRVVPVEVSGKTRRLWALPGAEKLAAEPKRQADSEVLLADEPEREPEYGVRVFA